jgi:formate hydrogenlyase transcriptional activator
VPSDTPSIRRDLLLDIGDLIGQHRDLESLFAGLSEVLQRIVAFDLAAVHLFDESAGTITLHRLGAQPTAPSTVPVALDDSAVAWIVQTQRPLTIRDVDAPGHPPAVARSMQEHGLHAGLLLPMTTAVRRVGVLGFGSRTAGAYDAADLELLRRAADLVAVAVDNARHSQLASARQTALERERDRWRALLEVTTALVSTLDMGSLLNAVASCLTKVVAFDVAGISLYDERRHSLESVASFSAGGVPLPPTGEVVALDGTALDRAFASREPLVVNDMSATRAAVDAARRFGIGSACAIPLIGPRRTVGAFFVASREAGHFNEDDVELLSQVGRQIAVAIENALSYREIEALSDRLRVEAEYLRDEIRGTWRFEDIVGRSESLRHALEQLEDVAPTDTTVLLLGETGTGKELFARAIHDLSPRRQRTLVKVNCAAIPSGLLESELFGHEKGAFTGALDRKIGRFELADGGTIFLDEIGDIPLELQTKLLRVLQEREFERLGSTRSTRVDVRVVAATNQDLQGLVAARQFRSDLYYRLNVFPLSIPPLRDRNGDIPLLVRHFVQKHSKRLKKVISRIPAEAVNALERWCWPGNVRELESVIERAVIRSHDGVLKVAIDEGDTAGSPANATTAAGPATATAGTLDAIEREHILRTLHETGWVVAGPRGAATRLGMKRSTLVSRMRKLGIERAASERRR